MKAKLNKEFIIRLIAYELASFRLISRLAKINKGAWAYMPKNSETVFEIMGFDESKFSSQEHYMYYLRRRNEALDIEQIEACRWPFIKLAENIYNELERRVHAQE